MLRSTTARAFGRPAFLCQGFSRCSDDRVLACASLCLSFRVVLPHGLCANVVVFFWGGGLVRDRGVLHVLTSPRDDRFPMGIQCRDDGAGESKAHTCDACSIRSRTFRLSGSSFA